MLSRPAPPTAFAPLEPHLLQIVTRFYNIPTHPSQRISHKRTFIYLYPIHCYHFLFAQLSCL